MTSQSYPSPSINTEYHSIENYSRLLAITEESIFLQDGVFRAQDLIPKSFDGIFSISETSAVNVSQLEELLSIGATDTYELGRKIHRLSTLRVQDIGRHHRCQFQILKAVWKHKKEQAVLISKELEANEKEKRGSNDTLLGNVPLPDKNISFKLSLCLLIPILKSYCESNTPVALSTVKLLFEELSNMPIMSLTNESSSSIVQLEEMLCEWVFQNGEAFQASGSSALLALSFARGRLASYLKTICVLEKCKKNAFTLPAGKMLKNLEDMGQQNAKPCAIVGDKHFLTWPMDTELEASAIEARRELGLKSHKLIQPDFASSPHPQSQSIDNQASLGQANKLLKKESEDMPLKTFVATDGEFLYVTGPKGKGLAKIGNGLGGHIRGWVYTKNIDLNCGFLAYSRHSGLLSRSNELDRCEEKINGKNVFGVLLDKITLQPTKLLLIDPLQDLEKPFISVGMTSDGEYFYLLRCETPNAAMLKDANSADHTPAKVLRVYLDVFKIMCDESQEHASVVFVRDRVILQKGDDLHLETTSSSGSSSTGNSSSERAELRSPIVRLRSLRVTNVQPPTSSSNQPSVSLTFAFTENLMTSLGLHFRQIIQSFVFSCGNFFTVIVAHYWPPIIGPTTTVINTQAGSCTSGNTIVRQYSPVVSQHCTRSIGIQLHVPLHQESLRVLKQDLVNMPINSSFHHGSVIQQMSAAYDAKNNIIWTTNGDYMDMWNNPGHIPNWRLNELLLRSYSEEDTSFLRKAYTPTDLIQDVSTSEVVSKIMLHIGRMGIHFLQGDAIDADIGFNPEVIESILDLLYNYLRQLEPSELKSIFVVLKSTISKIKTVQQGTSLHNNLRRLQTILFCFMSDKLTIEKFSRDASIFEDVGELFALLFDFLYTKSESRSAFFKEMDDFFSEEVESDSEIGTEIPSTSASTSTPRFRSSTPNNSKVLTEAILGNFTKKLNRPDLEFEGGVKWVLDILWFNKLLRESVSVAKSLLCSNEIDNTKPSVSVVGIQPFASVETKYVQAVVNFIIRVWSLSTANISEALVSLGIEVFKTVLNQGCILAESAIETICSTENLSLRVYSYCDNILKSSIMGLVIPQLLAFLISTEKETKRLKEGILEECIQLTVAMSHLAEKLNCNKSPDSGEDWSTKIKVPSPWSYKKVLESSHPIKETSKIKETIVVPDARQLMVKFSPQCASQYDYDKLTLFQGCGTNAKKVAEFGGNYYGCGTRNFVGPGWPRDLIKIDGNIMTYSFEIRSTRESATIEKAVYGYLFTILPKYDYSDPEKPLSDMDSDVQQFSTTTNGIASLISLHCIDVMQSIVFEMFLGNSSSADEDHCSIILLNGLVSRLKWLKHKNILAQVDPIPMKIGHEFILRLKRSAGVAPLQIRPTQEDKLKINYLEDLYLQCCLKHLEDNPYLNATKLTPTSDPELLTVGKTHKLLQTICRNMDKISRQVIAISEMERMLIQEVDEVSKGIKEINEVFFCEQSFMESKSDMETLAMTCDFEYDSASPTALVNDVTAMVQAFIEDGSVPRLTKADELIEETCLKCRSLLLAEKRQDGRKYEWKFEEVSARLADIQTFLYSHFGNAKATMINFYQAVKSTTARALSRSESFDILLKVLRCSEPNAALLTVAALILVDGPGLSSIACSGYEEEVLCRYGEAMKTVVSMALQDPLLHRFTVAVLCVIHYDRTDEKNLVDSKLLGILDQLCAYQTHVPATSCQESETAHSKLPIVSLLTQEINAKASTLAWSAFRVLATQCASWEKKQSSGFFCLEEEASNELPIQISLNATNHLARAANLAAISTDNGEEDIKELSCAPTLTDAIQDVLGLLSSLQEYKIGRAILKQSPCICRLLSLLQDARLSPRLVLTILKLLNTALPLVDDLDTSHLSQILENKKKNQPGTSSASNSTIELNPYHQVTSMLLSKLADFLVCGSQHPGKVGTPSHQACDLKTASVAKGLFDPSHAKIGVWIQKRSDQLAAPMLRQIYLDNSRMDLRPSRTSLNQLETELNAEGKVLLYTEDPAVAERKAMRLGQLGCIVSLIPSNLIKETEKSKTTSQGSIELLCKDRNANLVSLDPPRPFISGQVAECLASEIVQLLQTLMDTKDRETYAHPSAVSSEESVGTTSSIASLSIDVSTRTSHYSEDLTADIVNHMTQKSLWSTALEQIICLSLKSLPKLFSIANPTTVPLESFAFSARLAIASLTVLGAFTETIRPGSEVWVVENSSKPLSSEANKDSQNTFDNWGFIPCKARVIEVAEGTGTAVVEVEENSLKEIGEPKTYRVKSRSLLVSRLVPIHCRNGEYRLPTVSKIAQCEIASYLKTLLSSNPSKTESFALRKELPSLHQIVASAGITSASTTSAKSGHVSESRAIAHGMTVVRLLAEIRSRCTQVLSLWLKNRDFMEAFLETGSQMSLAAKSNKSDVASTVKALKTIAKECKPSQKANSIESQIAALRLLYRDCTRPPRLALTSHKSSSREANWNTSKTFPKVKSCVISESTGSIVYVGDYNAVGGQPRGLLLYATNPVPFHGLYWESSIVSMEESSQNPDNAQITPPVSIGFAPEAVPPEQQRISEAWRYPAGTVLFTVGGRIHHYKSQDPSSWIIERIEGDLKLKVGDTFGIGWEKLAPVLGQTPERLQNLSTIRENVRQIATGSIPIPPPPPPSVGVGSARRIRLRASNGTLQAQRNTVTPPVNNSAFGPKGKVFFTLNGIRLPNVIEQSNCGLFPIVHLQRRNVIVSTNFGSRPFVYSEAKNMFPSSVTTNRRGQHIPAESSDSGVLLRRVSDSLQDLSAGWNFDDFSLEGIDSESDLDVHRITDSNDTLSADSSSEGGSENAVIINDDVEVGTEAGSVFEGDEGPNSFINSTEPIPIPNDEETGNSAGHVTVHVSPPSPPRNLSTDSNETLHSNLVQNMDNPGTILMAKKSDSGNKKPHFVAKPCSHKSNEYNPVASLEYFLEPSPTNGIKIFSGPNRNVCTCSLHCPSSVDFLLIDKPIESKPSSGTPSSSTQQSSDIDDDDDYDEEEDIHSQLVRAWELQVFPVIRRRFRNESERRDGLEQIKGALQLGMIEIARQTVEFLYEENGGLPRDLHLPTLDEVKAEAARCTMEKVRPGMSVLIRPLADLGSSDSVLPNYAVAAMLRTFGLVGEVLEIDKTSELVLVETYVESEGILLRFWYPVVGLDKPQLLKKPNLNATTVNMFKLHSNLLSLESSLFHLHCRSAFLDITYPPSKDQSYEEIEESSQQALTNASISERLDSDNIKILSDQLLNDFPANGDLMTKNLSLDCPSVKFLTEMGNPTIYFYKNSEKISQILSAKIQKAIAQSEEALTEVTAGFLQIFEGPEKFPIFEAQCTKVVDTDIYIPDSAFSLICVKGLQPPKNAAIAIDNVLHPMIHISSYDSSDIKRHPTVCYPLISLFSSMPDPPQQSGRGGRSQVLITSAKKVMQSHRRKIRFPPVLVPSDKLHLSVSETSLKGLIIHIQGLPSDFPLALLYCQTLMDCYLENDQLPINAVVFAVTKIIHFLCRTSFLPPVVKEWMFTLIDAAINLKKPLDSFPQEFPLLGSSLSSRLFTEMLFTYEKESEGVSISQANVVSSLAERFFHNESHKRSSSRESVTSNSSGTLSRFNNRFSYQQPESSGGKGLRSSSSMQQLQENVNSFFEDCKVNDVKGFGLSAYCYSLVELCLSINQLQDLTFNPMEILSPQGLSATNTPPRKPSIQNNLDKADLATSSHSSSVSAGGPGNKSQLRSVAPRAVSKKRSSKGSKSVHLRTERNKSHKHQPMPVSPEANTAAKQGSSGVNKCMEDGIEIIQRSSELDWFHKAEYILLALRNIIWDDRTVNSIQAVNDLLFAVSLKISSVSTHERLLVIYGAPINLSGISVETSIMKALKDSGGIFGNELWVSGNCAVVELRCNQKITLGLESLKQNRSWYPTEDFLLYPSVNVHRVGTTMQTGDPFGDQTLMTYLRSKVSESSDFDQLCAKAEEALTAVFMSCYVSTQSYEWFESENDSLSSGAADNEFGVILLAQSQLNMKIAGNLMEKFIMGVKPDSYKVEDFAKEILKKFGEPKVRPFQTAGQDRPSTSSQKAENGFDADSSDNVTNGPYGEDSTFPVEENNQPPNEVTVEQVTLQEKETVLGLSQNGFLRWCTLLIRDNIQGLWCGIFATGFDLRFDRAWPIDSGAVLQYFTSQWTKGKDAALASFMDSTASLLHISAAKLHLHEIYFTETDLANPTYRVLQGIPIEYLRVRAGLIQSLNQGLAQDLLPVVGLHKFNFVKRSVASLIHEAKYLIFYDAKEHLTAKLLHTTALRGGDVLSPEISLDPVSAIDANEFSEDRTLVHQAVSQLQNFTSALYCIFPSASSDPALPLNVKYQGEEVLGLSGSFRHFILHISKELQQKGFNILSKCPSSGAGRNKDSLIFYPGPLSIREEELLFLLGQIMGIAVRADTTIPFSFLKVTWRSLLMSAKEINDTSDDLLESDVLCAGFIKKLQTQTSQKGFDSLISMIGNQKFQYPSAAEDSMLVPLCPGGKTLTVSFSNKDQFIRLIQKLRTKELKAENRVNRILAGLATVIPLPALLNTFSTSQIEHKLCGSSDVDLALLKAHTHYQVGVSETDSHVMYFWSALESFTSEELRKFINFACNLERLPATCPCQSLSPDHQGYTTHVAPFPMKIAPIDIAPNIPIEDIDKRLIRVETCLFLVRLPPYSSLQVTKQQLLYSINCRDDPLSG